VTGTITEKAAQLTGLKAGTIVVGGAGDNAAAAVGTGVVADGKALPQSEQAALYLHILLIFQ
jgi:xylulokinase